ncbi:hypothetical protein ACLI09_05280 [Flavobacterium sp. RHBU_24]|uniref:hypothetical protein n=1 Tax=Flavobacterium sp. RHBU_24 TaxID=3391185 RepID=UPI00398563A6
MKKRILKNILAFGLLTTLIFWLGKLYSYQNGLPVDGSLTYGFPLTYYEIGSGMDQDIRYEDLQHTDYGNLTIDILFAMLTAAVLLWIYSSIKKRLF